MDHILKSISSSSSIRWLAQKTEYALDFKQIFDPSSEFIVQWKKLMFVAGLMNIFLDPMFMYIVVISVGKSIDPVVLYIDEQLATTLVFVRLFGDFVIMLGIIVRFRTAYEAPGLHVFKRRRLIIEPRAIALNYCKSTFILDLLAVLPLTEGYMWHQLSSQSRTPSLYYLYTIFIIQLPLRFFVLIHSKREITKTAGILMKSAMSGAFYNLLWFMTLSNIVGAMYYYTHVYWLMTCMELVPGNELDGRNFEWDQFLSNCTQNNDIEQGMFSSALTNRISSRNFIQRYMFCFSFGLKSMSSLGQNFNTSFSTLETIFSITVTLSGLILFADLITRMQAGIQSMEEREEQQRARQREVKDWMEHHQLPVELKERVDDAIQSEWTENGIEDDAMLDSFPMDLRSEIRRYLYMDSVSKLPKFANMDAPLVEAICPHLKTYSGRKGTYIVFEGDIVKQMFFIFSGQLELSFTDRGNSSVTILGAGECCGQELVTWASLPTTSMDSLPTSSWTIKCLTDVEAFVLQAYDMKILATQFAHNQDFQRAFKQHYP